MTTSFRSRRTLVFLAAVTSTLALTGCTFRGAASFSLPGGEGGGGYVFSAEFEDVLDLVPQSAVKVNDVTVGAVRKIELDASGYTAVVTMQVRKDVSLPENVDARLRQTSLLGEKFVSLEVPDAPVGTLREGMTIGLERTSRNVDIEEVLGALSLVLNGGSIEQLQVINSELTKTLAGREVQVRDFLRQLSTFMGGLDDQKSKIVAALDSLDRLSAQLAKRTDTLDVALRDLPKGAAVLADERAQLTKMLTGLKNLGTVATRVIQATQQNTVADLKALQPVLAALADAGQDLPNALELLTTYPFPRTVADPLGKGGIRGDYANLFVTIEGDPATLLNNLLAGLPVPIPLPTLAPGGAPAPSAGGRLPAPSATVRPPSGLVPQGTEDLIHMLLGGLRD